MPSEFSTMSRVRSAFAVIPWMQLTRRLSTACSIVESDVNNAKVITGSITLSCSWPADAANVTVRSSPITRKPTWLTTSGITGLTLPGMIDEPGCICGRLISLNPQRGPQHVGAGGRRGLDQVAGQDELLAREFREVLGRKFRITRRCRDRRSDRGGAKVDLVQELAHFGDALHLLADRRAPAVELLAERHRHGILQVGATHLQHSVELLRLRAKRLLQRRQRIH